MSENKPYSFYDSSAEIIRNRRNERPAFVPQTLKNIIGIQCQDGNWNYNEYMRGLANGLLLAESVLTNEEYRPFDRPDVYVEGRSRASEERFSKEFYALNEESKDYCLYDPFEGEWVQVPDGPVVYSSEEAALRSAASYLPRGLADRVRAVAVEIAPEDSLPLWGGGR